MAKIKLTKSVVDAAQAQASDVELRDTVVPGFLCKVTPTGRKVFMLLQWDWLDLPNGRVVWPDSKTGDMSKPLSEEARRLLTNAPRYGDSPYVCPAILNHSKPLSSQTYYQAWRRILERAAVPKVGTYGIRHRSAPDIANSDIPIKVGMALTVHKTVAMFMRYVHTEDDAVRKVAELVATRRKSIVGACQEQEIKWRLGRQTARSRH